MTSQEQLQNIVGTTAYDRDGDKLGKIGQVYYDDSTDQPKWVTVNTGLFGLSESFVPLRDANFSGDKLTVGYDKATVKNAPNINEDGHLSPEEERSLYSHYGLDYSTGQRTGHDADRSVGHDTDRGVARDDARDNDRRTDRDHDRDNDRTGVAGTIGAAGRTHDRDDTRSAGHDTSGPNTDNAMTRSEEHLVAGTQTEEAGRARLRKRVVTEQQQVQVPVSREELVVNREPITDRNRGEAYGGAAITEEEHEVTLHAERPVVTTEAEAVERVQVGTETVRDTETVSGEVRKEEIDVDDTATGRGRDTDRDRDRR